VIINIQDGTNNKMLKPNIENIANPKITPIIDLTLSVS
jgi:hypothetical protein